MFDPTLQILEGLEPETRSIAIELVDALRSYGYPAILTSGRRELTEQRELLRMGKTRTLQSLHLQGRAFDLDLMGYRRDDIPQWFWQALGAFAESLGLKWGGRWKTIVDLGHFELPRQ